MRFTKTILAIILTGSLSAGAAHSAEMRKITDLDIKGNERIEVETIRALLVQEEGGGFSDESINKSLKKLFDSGYFMDVDIKIVGSTLVVKVIENASINRVAFEGNDEVSDEILKTEVGLLPRQPLTRAKLKSAANKIQRIYRLKGHFAAAVTPKIIKREQNRVDVVFEIVEGAKTKVSRIFFIGNKQYSDSKLEERIQTKESRWYRFFTSDDNYDPDRLAYDQELLRLFYLEHGYADFKVKSAVAELTQDKREFFITFTLDEGERYKIGKIEVASQLKDVDPASLRRVLSVSENSWYNNKEVERSVDHLINELGKLGYAFVDVFPNITKNQETKTLDINFELAEGPRVFIETIQINGNDRTDDDVIRRELTVYEGDAFNADKMKKSERRIRNLGFFKDVKVKKEPGSYPDRVNLIIDVEEDRTGELSIAGGFSTADGPLANAKFSEHNFRGRGQELEFGVTWAKRRQEFDVSFTEPYFMGRDLAAGIDLFRITQNQYFNQTFDQEIHGATGRLGYELAEDLGQRVSYTIRQDKISGIKQDSSRFIREQKGTATVSELAQTITYDKRDSRINPTEGWVTGFSNNLAGLGGTVRYLKNSVFGGYYYSFFEDVILEVSGNYSFMTGLGKKVRVTDRYHLGGETFRGFETSGVSPRDRSTGDPLGGLQSYRATAEVTFPLGLPSELPIKGAVFSDAGSVWKSNDAKSEIKDSSNLRLSAGVGLRWRSPLGPLKIDFARAVKKENFDKTQVFLFGFSSRF
jgi:outer membrane protein assembly complex, YaeT protein